jgi:lipopolysaccharide export system permease protein
MNKLTIIFCSKYIISFLWAVGILVCLFSLFEFSEQLEDVGSSSYGYIHAVFYVLLTMPGKALELSPFSAILGSTVFLGAMVHRRELLALRVCGVSGIKICGLVLMASVGLAVVIIILTEFGIPALNQKAYMMRANHLSKQGSLHKKGFWAQNGFTFLNIRSIESNWIYRDIYVYSFNHEGGLENFIYAKKAHVQEDQTWKLFDVVKNHYDNNQILTEELKTMEWHSFIGEKQRELLSIPAHFLSYSQLYYILHNAGGQEKNLKTYQLAFWHKIAAPLAVIALTLIVLPFLVCKINIRKSLSLSIPLGVIGGGLFYLLTKLLGYLALVLNINPALLLLSPILLIFVFSLWMIHRICMV